MGTSMQSCGQNGLHEGESCSRCLDVWCSRQLCHCSGAGLRNGAFFLEPRPFFFTHVMGVSAYMLGRSILMKAVGMWHWEVRFCASLCMSLCNILVISTTANQSLLRSKPSDHSDLEPPEIRAVLNKAAYLSVSAYGGHVHAHACSNWVCCWHVPLGGQPFDLFLHFTKTLVSGHEQEECNFLNGPAF